jgi:predicted transcriptional regulator
MGKISVSAPDEVIERWKQYAKERDMSVSQFARRALEAYCMLIEKRKGQK